MRNRMIRLVFAGVAAAFAAAVLTAPAAHAAPGPHSSPAATKTTQAQPGRVVKITSSEQFDDAIQNSRRVVVEAYASLRCPCKIIRPYYDTLATNHKSTVFLAFDVDDVPELASKLEISGMPTFLSFYRGDVLDKVRSANPLVITPVVRKLNERD